VILHNCHMRRIAWAFFFGFNVLNWTIHWVAHFFGMIKKAYNTQLTVLASNDISQQTMYQNGGCERLHSAYHRLNRKWSTFMTETPLPAATKYRCWEFYKTQNTWPLQNYPLRRIIPLPLIMLWMTSARCQNCSVRVIHKVLN
jgi:hypothetical protein